MRNQGTGKTATRRKRKELPKFEGAKFGFELKKMIVLPSGAWQLVVDTPAEDRDEVFKLSLTAGLLLEASVSLVEGLVE
jgi:hypothetical protein